MVAVQRQNVASQIMVLTANSRRWQLSLLFTSLPWFVLGLGLLASVIGWKISRESQLHGAEREFRAKASLASLEIRTRLLDYEQLVRGGAALIDATGSISRSQWRAYVERLAIGESFPGVEGVGFAQVVTDHGRDAHVRAIRAEGPPDYDIWPAGQRNVYMPVIRLEPRGADVTHTIGNDLFANHIQRAAMERARDLGTVTMSGKVGMAPDANGKGQASFLLVLPVYRLGRLPQTVEERRNELSGYVYAPFRVEHLMGDMLKGLVDGIDLEIFDVTTPSGETLMFDRDKIPRFINTTVPVDFSVTSTLALNGRLWTLRYAALPTFFASRMDQTPLLMLAGGGLISFLLFGLTWAARRTRAHAFAFAKTLEAVAIETENRFTGIFHSAMDAIITIDHTQHILHFNPAAEQVFGCSAAHATGSALTRFMPQRFRVSHQRHVEQFGATGVSDRQMGKQLDLFGLRANGEEFPLEASISHNIQNGKMFYTVILRDITLRKRAEAALRDSEQRFRSLIEVSPEAIYIHEGDTITFVNKAAQVLFGAARPEELIGKSIYALFHPDVESNVRQVMASLLACVPSTPILECKIVRLDGEIRYVEVAASVFEDAGKRACQGIMRDVTDRYLAQAELERSHDELRQLSIALETAQEEERKRIARELHDDLGQHLTVLKMDMSSVKAKLRDTQTNAAVDAGVIEDIERMDGLLNHTVQSIRRISADLRPLLLDDLGLVTALEALVNQVSRSSNIHCSLRLDPHRLLIDQSLATPLYRIAQEALNNVVKHAQATEATITLHRDATNSLVLEVRDNGKGFVPWKSRKAVSFGLIGMRERVYALRGEILIESRPGGGTTIRVTIPNTGKDPEAETNSQRIATDAP